MMGTEAAILMNDLADDYERVALSLSVSVVLPRNSSGSLALPAATFLALLLAANIAKVPECESAATLISCPLSRRLEVRFAWFATRQRCSAKTQTLK